MLGGRVLISTEPHEFSQLPSGALPAVDQLIANDPRFPPFYQQDRIIRAAGGNNALEYWVSQISACQADGEHSRHMVIDYSPIVAGFKGLLPSKSNGKQSCSDDDGLLIDSCAARLKRYKPDEYDLVVLHHIYGLSLRKIGKKHKYSDGTIRKEMQAVEGFINGVLCVLNITLHIGLTY
ncbi:antiterminator Q family protein [Serratia fonticola]|uniref:antiterminator Q family protein n=1 Tax=Serratia fonticola TaxID=47917 RepID=UPI0027E7540C|nr:antiterminator Q family protein [Serratia fonticola]MDQ7207432.1 antiterminator Q family protein [Serratia fonticola]